MGRPILLVCGCERYRPFLTAAMRRFANPAWELIGLVGGGQHTVYDDATQILTVAAPDIYEALPTKIHAAFAWIAAHRPAAPGVFKIDDDIVLETHALVHAVGRMITDGVPYGGLHPSTCIANFVDQKRIHTRFEDKTLRPRYHSAHYCYGHGYWVSNAALPLLVAATTDYATSYLEDVCTGYVLNCAGIRPVKMPVSYREVERGPELLALT